MTAAELLKPRRIVELDYPNSPFKIGDILEFDEKQNMFYSPFESDKIFYNVDVEKYPHIFRPLKWWEHRKVEDMPKRVISTFPETKGTIKSITKMDLKNNAIYLDGKLYIFPKYCEYGYFPID